MKSIIIFDGECFRIFKEKLRRIIQGIVNKPSYGEFGKNSVIISPLRVIGKKYIHVEDNVTILHNARLEVTKGNNDYTPFLRLGKNTAVGQNLHLITSKRVKIGENVTISGNVFISDTNHDYESIEVHSLLQRKDIFETEIGDYCFIGYGAVIMPGVHLGKQCIVGANAVVLKGLYADYSVIAGVPAKVIKRYNPSTESWEKISNGEA